MDLHAPSISHIRNNDAFDNDGWQNHPTRYGAWFIKRRWDIPRNKQALIFKKKNSKKMVFEKNIKKMVRLDFVGFCREIRPASALPRYQEALAVFVLADLIRSDRFQPGRRRMRQPSQRLPKARRSLAVQ